MSIVLEKMAQSWLPADVEPISSIVELAGKYSDQSLAFAVFKSGTVIYSDKKTYDSDDTYLSTLADFCNFPPDSNLIIMKDGNYVVEFLHTIRGIVSNDFYKSNRSFIEKNIEGKGILSGEHLFQDNKRAMRGDRFYIGMYARAKVFKDVLNPEIVFRFDAKMGENT